MELAAEVAGAGRRRGTGVRVDVQHGGRDCHAAHPPDSRSGQHFGRWPIQPGSNNVPQLGTWDMHLVEAAPSIRAGDRLGMSALASTGSHVRPERRVAPGCSGLLGVVQIPPFSGYTKRAETADLQGSNFGGKGVLCGRRRASPGQARWG